jgi:hypothetical protein
LRSLELKGKDIGRIELNGVVTPFFVGFWQDLSGDRSVGFGGIGAVPYPSKMEWLRQNVEESLWDLGLFVFRTMDSEFMSYTSEKAKAKKKK